jgi:hypothetical protein
MSIVQQMIGILQSRVTQNISFSFIGTTGQVITVDQNTFRRVVRAFQHGHFEIASDVPPGKAAYNKDSSIAGKHGKFRINPAGGDFRELESLIVHESVHASFDLTFSVLPFVDNEVAAHLAQAKYYQLAYPSISYFSFNYQPLMSAYMIMSNLPTGPIPSANLEGLRNELRGFRAYQSYINTTFNGNG